MRDVGEGVGATLDELMDSNHVPWMLYILLHNSIYNSVIFQTCTAVAACRALYVEKRAGNGGKGKRAQQGGGKEGTRGV